VTDVTNGQKPPQVAGTDAQLVRELAERARARPVALATAAARLTEPEHASPAAGAHRDPAALRHDRR
jgi:hypothetical protein